MKWICFLLPACFSMLILYRRNGNKMLSDSVLTEIFRYGCWSLTVNIFTIFTVLYVLGYGSLLMEVFDSFSFSMKYAMIAVVYACVIPYVVEVGRKYISVTFTAQAISKEK